MDSTLFDYKNSSNDASRGGSRLGMKGQRPTSAQAPKFLHGAYDSSQGNAMPQIGAATRARPTTAINRQAYNQANDTTKNIPNNVIEELEAEEEQRLLEKVGGFGEGTQMQDLQRLMPKNINVEKERLYEDTLHLKQNINGLKEENLKLKTKNLNLERENAKLVKAVEKMGSYTTQFGKQPESTLIVTLKKQVKEQKEELKAKNDEVESMKRSAKMTRVQEIEIELKTYMDENIRLRNAFEELMRLKPEIKPEDYNMLEERYYQQGSMIETLQRDHARIGSEIKYLEEENYNLRVAKDHESKTIQVQKSEISKLKKLVKEKDQKLSNAYKAELSGYHRTGYPKNEKGDHDEHELRRQLEQKEQALIQRDKTIDDLKQKLNGNKAAHHGDPKNQSPEVNKLKEQYAELESKYRALLNVHYPASDEKKKPNEGRPSSKFEGDLSVESRDEPKGKKLKRVSPDDANDVGYELSLKLRIRRVPLEDVIKQLERSGSRLSIHDLRNIFAQEPFKIKDENNALLLARYLVEPRDEETVVLDMNRNQDTSSIKNLLRKLVGNYTLLDEDEAKEMGEDLGEIISKYEESLQTQFAMMPESKTGYLSSDQIAQAFEELDINVDAKEFEYLIMNLYEYTGNLKRLDFMKMFEIFETEDHKKMKKLMEMYQHNEGDSERSDKKVKFKENKPYERPRSAGHNKQKLNKDDDDDDYEDGEDEPYDEGEEEYEEDDYEEDADHADN